MENTYHLVVDRRARRRLPRILDEYASADRLIADADDDEGARAPSIAGPGASRRMVTQP